MRSLQRELYRLRREKPGLIKNADFYAVLKAGFFLPVEDVRPPAGKPGRRSRSPLRRVRPAAAVGVERHGVRPARALRGFSTTCRRRCRRRRFRQRLALGFEERLRVDDLVAGIAELPFRRRPLLLHPRPGQATATPIWWKRSRRRTRTACSSGTIKFCEPDAFDRPQLLRAAQAGRHPRHRAGDGPADEQLRVGARPASRPSAR
ncbi:MAG: 2-hydroxyacyl-CoA dehydratase family protein [Desulfomicrobium escambiense]|nr:2-hydroxyacyl-CoA dehydratase family protein [Desulfomicrobium escambiense]